MVSRGACISRYGIVEKKAVKNIWMLSREYGELAGAGGVKDVVYQLSKALACLPDYSVKVVLPYYGFMEDLVDDFVPVKDPFSRARSLQLSIPMNEPGRLVSEPVSFCYARRENVHIYLIKALRFTEKRSVYTYTKQEENGWKKLAAGHHDYFAMNLLLQKGALELIIALGEHPDVLHCHDGHTALVPALVRELAGYRTYFRKTRCLTTIHNAGLGYHQEIADIDYARAITGFPDEVVANYQLDAKFDPLLVAGAFAPVNTVSENYAFELQHSNGDQLTGWLGHEFNKRGILLEGVTNGIDPDYFSPMADSIEEELRFDPADPQEELAGKDNCKKRLFQDRRDLVSYDGVQRFGCLSASPDGPLFTFVGRLNEQKGVDVLLEVLPMFLLQYPKATFAILGSGDLTFESRLAELAAAPVTAGRICYFCGFSPELASLVYRAGDYFVIPSRYEPCGLTDFIAQLYGSIPVVNHVGGLVKVVDGVTGLAFNGATPDALLGGLQRACALEQQLPTKREMQRRAVEIINKQYTWSKVVYNYLDLYARK